MSYLECAPRADLAEVVKCVWTFDAAAKDTEGPHEHIVPDGSPELIIHFGTPFAEVTPLRGREQQPRAFVMGQTTRPLILDAGRGDAGVVGVRFHPWGARALTGAPMNEFTDSRITLADLTGTSANCLIDQIASADGARRRIEIVQNFVAARIANNARYQDTSVSAWSRRLSSSQGRLSIGTLADNTGVSLRHFERRFRTQVGISPRLFANIVRFRSVFDNLSLGVRPHWTQLALDAGYFDQSHLTRDFQRFAGRSPAAFVADLQGLSAALVGLDEEVSSHYKTGGARSG